MILLSNLLKEARLHTFNGAKGKKTKKYRNMCHLVARRKYYQLKKRGKNIRYVEGEVYVPMKDIVGREEWKWIDHAWNIIDGKVVDFALGQNNYKYKGYIVKDEYMEQIPDWMTWAGSDDKCDINIRVGKEFGKKVYE